MYTGKKVSGFLSRFIKNTYLEKFRTQFYNSLVKYWLTWRNPRHFFFLLFQYGPREWWVPAVTIKIFRNITIALLFDPGKNTYLSPRSAKTTWEGIFLQHQRGFLIPQPVCPKLHSLYWHNVRQQKHQKTYGFSQTSTYTHFSLFVCTMCLGCLFIYFFYVTNSK